MGANSGAESKDGRPDNVTIARRRAEKIMSLILPTLAQRSRDTNLGVWGAKNGVPPVKC
jgi:hypothetical protein